MSDKTQQTIMSSPVYIRLGKLVAGRGRRKALEVLDSLIEDRVPLFEGHEWVIEERRLAWLYRIELLREIGRLTEALAWACLEAELHPDNITAQALKERLKRETGLLPLRLNRADGTSQSSSLTPWAGVAGMRELKAMLERDVVLPFQEPEIYARYRLNLPNGILLYGPPGCGKTFIARRLATVVGFAFKEVKPGDLASTLVHGTQEKIAALFTEAEETAPCVLFFDEMDAMVPRRDGSSVGHHYASEVNEFLVRLNDCSRQGILVVGATNLPHRIDPALMRPGRLDKKFFVGPPDFEARVELLEIHTKDRPQAKIEWLKCAAQLENHTCAEIEFIVNEAARKALVDRRPICTDDIFEAILENPATHSAEQLIEMRRITWG